MSKEKEPFYVYITKYALTEGIFTKEVQATDIPSMVCSATDKYVSYYHGEGRKWHRTWESAQRKAEDMRKKKILSLEQQINTLKNLTFNQKEK